MDSSASTRQLLNFGSPMRTPTGTPTGSHKNSPIKGRLFEVSPIKRISNFHSPSPKKGKGISLVQSPSDVMHESTFQFKMDSPIPEMKTRVPLEELLVSLSESNVISPVPKTGRRISSTPVLGTGSFATVSSSPNSPDCVLKTYKLGANGKKSSSSPKVDNTMMLRMLGAFNRCNRIPGCARVDSIQFSKKGDDWEMNVKQEMCSVLSNNNLKAFLECVVALLREFIPKGQYPTDIKKANFGMKNNKVVWFDFDFKDLKKGKVPSLVSSGEFQFEGNELFQQLLLVLLDFNEEIKGDRKEIFRDLNQQKGLLQKHGLLSSEKSISETTIEDFVEVLRNIGLSEEDNAYLVGLIVPSPSSQ